MRSAFLITSFIGVAVLVVAASSLAQSSDDRGRDGQGTPWLGVRVQELDETLREAFDVRGAGVLVNQVIDGSPADDVGLRSGDVITHVDGESVDSAVSLRRAIRRHGVGPVEIEFLRRGRARYAEVVIGHRPGTASTDLPSRPPAPEVVPEPPRAPEAAGERDCPVDKRVEVIELHQRAYLGVRLEELSDDLAPYFDVQARGGALVIEVLADSPADAAGLRGGDVIVAIDDDRVREPSALREVVRSHQPGEQVTIELIRRGELRAFEVTLGEHESPVPGRLHRLPEIEREDFERLGRNLYRKYHHLRRHLDEEPVRLDERLERLEETVERLEREIERLYGELRR
jgi:S1-C subfamily serine protease